MRPTAAIGILFLSGCSAVIFETLWFRQASLAFGNSVWATTLVLCSFMGGLALGSALTSRLGRRVSKPLHWYAALELAIGTLGFGLVLLLPALASLLVPLFRPLLDQPLLLNPLRLLLALALLLAPATAMGATLPLMVGALAAAGERFGSVLGRLYGANTLGAVVGAIATEALLIAPLGVKGTALFAAGLNLAAAAGALLLSRTPAPAAAEAPPSARRLSVEAWKVLAASFLCGATLLALEVVWFRFLLLFVKSTNLALAVLLAVVLLGIGVGGIVGGALTRKGPQIRAWVSPIALVAAIAVVTLYGSLAHLPFDPGVLKSAWSYTGVLGLILMAPVALLSGIMFSTLGAAAHHELDDATRAAGLFTLVNTLGSLGGAFGAGFVLLPSLGMESSFLVLAIAYVGVALLTLRKARPDDGPWASRASAALLLLTAVRLAAFPYGLMEQRYLHIPVRPFLADGSRVVATREGLTETIIFLRRDLLGQPVHHRMVTNGFSMSGTHVFARRYMKLFVYWPLAFLPRARNALLISYGVGSTAKALTDERQLEHIDVVDISREVLSMAPVVYPDPGTQPLRDPRVKTHVEDGRFFLLTTDRRYDVITAEPPPPKNAGIVNLYTREYFGLIRDRLEESGIATYWLPVRDLSERDTKAIVAAFCGAFDDCSLWNGAGLDWMLVGSRGMAPAGEEQFARQWRDPVVSEELRALGFETPESLGATFIGDAEFLNRLTAGTEPLVDDHPKRLTENDGEEMLRSSLEFHIPLLDPAAVRARFAQSAWVARIWPEALRQGTLDAFAAQGVMNDRIVPSHLNRPFKLDFAQLHHMLSTTTLRTLPLWMMNSSETEQRIAQRAFAAGSRSTAASIYLGVGAVAARDWATALFHLEKVPLSPVADPLLPHLRAYALCKLDRCGEAVELGRAWRTASPGAADLEFWSWLEATFHLSK